MKKIASALALIFSFAGAVKAEGPDASPKFKKIMIVIFENTSYQEALSLPFFGSLAKGGALLSNYYAVAHPSQPNYVALISGSSDGVPGDGNVDLSRRHLGDLLEGRGLKWKVYAQGYPGNCYLGARAGKYARKHVPFLSFTNVSKDSKRCINIVEATDLDRDIREGTLPEFSLYIPDLRNDGHNTGAKFADHWFSSAFGGFLKDPTFPKDLLIAVTFDEDDHSDYNHIYTVLYGGPVIAGSVSKSRYTHYSLLRTVEDAFTLGALGENDGDAAAIAGVWR